MPFWAGPPTLLYYYFFQETSIEYFLQAVYEYFSSDDEYKIQGYAGIYNQKPDETITLENTRVWWLMPILLVILILTLEAQWKVILLKG